jgi:hypothetical protein
MSHLRGHLLDRTGELALRQLLVGKIKYDENDGSGSQCLHKRAPNQNQFHGVKRERVFELGHDAAEAGILAEAAQGQPQKPGLKYGIHRRSPC